MTHPLPIDAKPIDAKPIEVSQFADVLAKRDPAGHKGSFGSAAIVGGAAGMVGAVVLAARSALKSGSGRVYVGLAQASTDFTLDIVQPEIMWRDVSGLVSLGPQITAWGVGCGLGSGAGATQCITSVFTNRHHQPLVIDADGLNALAHGDVRPTWGQGPVVLTPHPTEASRLLGTDTASVQANRLEAARQLASTFNAWVVLKGQHTLVCDPDGCCQMNTTGNVGLATAGSGDVLTGLMTSLLAQGFDPDIAIPAAVWLHGKAAEHLVQRGVGPIGLTAGELIDEIRALRNR
jgi:hydroxyethylthiazole kinase-like uncharacterized protein yjeF